MTKQDLINSISERTTLGKSVVESVMTEVNSTIISALKKGEFVKISGFGTFFTKKRDGRVGRNPKTGESVEIPTKTVPKFRASRTLKEAL